MYGGGGASTSGSIVVDGSTTDTGFKGLTFSLRGLDELATGFGDTFAEALWDGIFNLIVGRAGALEEGRGCGVGGGENFASGTGGRIRGGFTADLGAGSASSALLIAC